jgi:hypothetical protein
MCNKIKTLAKTSNGTLTTCTVSDHYHLSFNNLFFDFNQEELNQFRNYICELDIDYWELQYPCPKLQKNIPIPSLQENLVLLFNRREIEELKKLVSFNKKYRNKFLRLDEIDYKLILN